MENLHLEQFDMKDPEQFAIAVAKVLYNKKATEVKVLKVEELTMLTSYFVIASGTSTTHVGSLADDVEFEIAKVAGKPSASEGFDSKNWILLDYASVIVHIFVPNTRTYYDLEHLWADGVPVDISAYLNDEEEA